MATTIPKSKTKHKPNSLIKRDASMVAFDSNKIGLAIRKAGLATGEIDQDLAHELENEVMQYVFAKHGKLEIIEIEKIQDSVERVLADKGYFATARAYIVYREQRKKQRADKKKIGRAHV